MYDVKVGDTVKILNGVKMVELLQKSHGGWEDSMATVIFCTDLESIYVVLFGFYKYFSFILEVSFTSGGNQENTTDLS